jgi:hypothetical protein
MILIREGNTARAAIYKLIELYASGKYVRANDIVMD